MGKAHIPRTSKVGGLSKLAAYSLSVMDYKRVSNADMKSFKYVICAVIRVKAYDLSILPFSN